MTPMAEKATHEDKSYHEWLTEALARDEDTWTALEEKLSRLRVKREARGDSGDGTSDARELGPEPNRR
jgi:hypothetical protein